MNALKGPTLEKGFIFLQIRAQNGPTFSKCMQPVDFQTFISLGDKIDIFDIFLTIIYFFHLRVNLKDIFSSDS